MTYRLALVAAASATWALATPLVRAADPAESAFDDAKRNLDEGKFDAAIAQLDAAIRLDPKQAKFHGMRGVAWLRKGDYPKGLADLKAAIQLNPGDLGAHYSPSSTKQLDAKAVQHGRRQVAQMLKDRPAMAQFGKEADVFSQWAARKFAGEDFDALIDWDPSPPLHSDAEHLAPAGNEHAAILVAPVYDDGSKRGRPRSFEELWAGAVYELHNVAYSREFLRLNDEADKGKVSKKAFVEGIVRYELRAAQQTRAFYVQVFLPWAEKKKLKTDPTLWFCDWWATPESALQSFTDKSAYPWRPYARTHDWATVHRHWRQQKFNRALKLLQRMCGEEGYEEDEADVHYWIGRCQQRLDKPQEALAEFSKSIRLDPDNAPAYEARAKLYQQLGENDKAKADLAKAKELEAAQ